MLKFAPRVMIGFVILFLVVVSHFLWKKSDFRNSFLLARAIRSSDVVRIIDNKDGEVLFEGRDVYEIRWLSNMFSAKSVKGSADRAIASRYRLVFYYHSEIVADIWFQKNLCFCWVGSKGEESVSFSLVPDSCGEVLPWLCERSGKGVNDLFPLTDIVSALRKRTLQPNDDKIIGIDEPLMKWDGKGLRPIE